ncbi:MAG: Piwi domain-containing protein [Nitrososphaerales archaeon]
MTVINLFKVENLKDLSCRYRLYKVSGISPHSDEYDMNVQLLSDQLSKISKSPCVKLVEDKQLYIAQLEGYSGLPGRVSLIGTEAEVAATIVERQLSFDALTDIDAQLAVRFLQFLLDGQLHDVQNLWRPSAGKPYFHKQADPEFKSTDISMYHGFSYKVVALPSNELAVSVDITRKYASKYFLPSRVTTDEFGKYKGRNAIYEYGHRWYEVRIEGISDFDTSNVRIENTNLFDHIHQVTSFPKPQALLTLPRDCSVFTYHTSLGQIRHMPSALLRLTYPTNHPTIREHHAATIMPPHVRKREIEFVVQKYLLGWKFQGVRVVFSDKMLSVKGNRLTPPDLLFGQGKILSFTGGTGTTLTNLQDFSYTKMKLLLDPGAGFFVRKNLDRQYLIMPKSMYLTFGHQYIKDLSYQFTRLYPMNGLRGWDPQVIEYDDSVGTSIYPFAKAVLDAVEQSTGGGLFSSGYGLVLIPRLNPRRPDKEDELTNMLMRELRKKDIQVSVAHVEIPRASYVATGSADGQTQWTVATDERTTKRYRGYLGNVALNKILLLNNCWPFALARPLNTDAVIGIDVKNNTAGFMYVSKNGQTFRFTSSTSDQKEQLGTRQVQTVVYELLKDELQTAKKSPSDITIHRDGRFFPQEMKGITEALNQLSREGILASNFNCNFVEIKKSSRVPVRFFEQETVQGFLQERTENPWVGEYVIVHNDAYVCTTGRPFRYRGTAKPIQVTKIGGKMELATIVEDVFALANLTWTKIDYCSRLPITMKMNDIRLREIAGQYSEDNFRFQEEGSDE